MLEDKLDQEHFSETNKELENNMETSEKYTFLEETIRPRKKTKLKKLIFTIVLGMIFGIVACFTIVAFFPVFSDLLGLNVDKIQIKNNNPDNLTTVIPSKTQVPTQSPLATVTPKPTKQPSDDSSPTSKEGSYASFISQIKKVRNIVGPSMVMVNGVKTGKDILDNPNEENKYASGIIVYKDASKALVMTNSDVVESASYITVILSDKTKYICELYGINKQMGVALVKLPAHKMDTRIYDKLVAAEMGDSAVVEIGEPVVAVGNPNGYMDSIDYGVISNNQQDAYITDGKVQLINTTIPHNSNGYGFIIDKKGRILGVITNKDGFTKNLNTDINTCLSISSIQPYLERMIEQKDNIYLGLVCSDINEDVDIGTCPTQGIYITKVEEKSPAFQAGIKKGDVLVIIDGERISSMIEYSNKLNKLTYKSNVTIKILREQEGEWVSMELATVVSKTN